MNLAELGAGARRPLKSGKRVGRGPGSGKGKTAGRGQGGAKSRAGWSTRLTYEGGGMPLFRRLPKRGFSNARFKTVYRVVNLKDLKAFDPGSTVGPEELRAARLVTRKGPIKILGAGGLDRTLLVRADAFSKGAREKIEAAGGRAEVV